MNDPHDLAAKIESALGEHSLYGPERISGWMCRGCDWRIPPSQTAHQQFDAHLARDVIAPLVEAHGREAAAAAESVAAEVLAERHRQDERWGEQNHPNGTGPYAVDALVAKDGGARFPIGIARWAKHRTDALAARGECTYEAILTEEWAEAVAEDDPARLRAELIQVAAVAVAWVEKIDRDRAAQHPEQAVSAEVRNPGPAWWPNPRDVPEDMTGPYPWSLLDCGCHLRQPDFEAVLCDEHLAELNHRTIPEPDSPASDERPTP